MYGHELKRQMELEHKGHVFTLTTADSKRWAITDSSGEDFGSLIMLAGEGADRMPVYGGVVPGETATLFEGSDWEGIARAVINVVVPRRRGPIE